MIDCYLDKYKPNPTPTFFYISVHEMIKTKPALHFPVKVDVLPTQKWTDSVENICVEKMLHFMGTPVWITRHMW